MKNKSTNFVKQKLELLSLKPEFQEDVFTFRKKWKIPKDGFRSDEDINRHDDWLEEISDKYRESEAYNKKRHSLFKKRSDSAKNGNRKLYREAQEEIRMLEMRMPLNDFFSDQKIISSKYNLSKNYKHTLDIFLRNGVFYHLYIPKSPIRTWREKDPENKDKKKIFIEIYGETTIKDIQDVWSMIKRWQKDTVGYKDGRKRSEVYFELHRKIYKLHLDGIKNKEITKIMKNESNRSFTYDEIGKIINRFKHGIMDT